MNATACTPDTPDPATRRAAVLEALRRGETLTTADALRYGWGWRLAADIHALRERGWEIQSELTQPGKGRRPIARYRLVTIHQEAPCHE